MAPIAGVAERLSVFKEFIFIIPLCSGKVLLFHFTDEELRHRKRLSDLPMWSYRMCVAQYETDHRHKI